ncbi:hypothetical protein X801_10700 [Opisthorchis viverrini]|uniref:FCP1 homology domain-containing protein n=1 Tax=Opisthorchis viverrini TaxID=6198 RepID=A0A1S8WGF4_OPIVI|nr:hypothetical protein X801_10700 [Opisthorchis viverrini]
MVEQADFKVGVEIDGVTHRVYVLKRPHVDVFLSTMANLYECVLFTASLAKLSGEPEIHLGPGENSEGRFGVIRGARPHRAS